jgi:hypothetical protein
MFEMRTFGASRLSQPENRVFDFNVDAIPPGFKVVRVEFGETVRPAIDLRIPDSANARPPTEAALLRRPQTGRGKPLSYVRTDFVLPSFS